MAQVPEDHVTIQYEVWTGLVLSCSNVYINCLVHELADMENWQKTVNKDGNVLKSMALISQPNSHYTAVVSYLGMNSIASKLQKTAV